MIKGARPAEEARRRQLIVVHTGSGSEAPRADEPTGLGSDKGNNPVNNAQG
jgi:hypothetical protein